MDGDGSPKGPKRRRGAHPGLTEQDLSLWRAVAQTVRAAPRSAKVARTEGPQIEDAPPQPAAPTGKAALLGSTRIHRPAPSVSRASTAITPAASPIDPLGPRTPGLDRRTAKRLSKGEHAPDARIDLHGMTAERAHSALIAFILREQSRGARCVLVITGKGRRNDRDATWRTGADGVLKTMAPEWLRQPPCGPLVVGVYQAHQRHGGDGALYVYLRKRR
ncbi:MAG: Smr/MutS family protein [Pseudomonadota bacterium]